MGVFLSFVAAAAATVGVTGDTPAPYPLRERDKADIVRQIKDKLLDGDSARWRWPLHEPKWGLYCGWVNAKNSYGAYVGWQPFLVVGGVGKDARGPFIVGYEMIGSAADEVATSTVIKMCAKSGYDMSAPPPEDGPQK